MLLSELIEHLQKEGIIGRHKGKVTPENVQIVHVFVFGSLGEFVCTDDNLKLLLEVLKIEEFKSFQAFFFKMLSPSIPEKGDVRRKQKSWYQKFDADKNKEHTSFGEYLKERGLC